MTARAPIFLDRDGTVIVELHYLSDPDAVRLETGVLEGLASLSAHGHPLIVVSNQSGIGRGMFTEEAARGVNQRAAELLARGGVDILDWYICPHVPEAACMCRKPAPGLPLTAARQHGLALAGSYVIGDKPSDLELADAIGGTGILVTSGHGAAAAGWARSTGRPVFGDMKAAAQFILAGDGQAPRRQAPGEQEPGGPRPGGPRP